MTRGNCACGINCDQLAALEKMALSFALAAAAIFLPKPLFRWLSAIVSVTPALEPALKAGQDGRCARHLNFALPEPGAASCGLRTLSFRTGGKLP